MAVDRIAASTGGDVVRVGKEDSIRRMSLIGAALMAYLATAMATATAAERGHAAPLPAGGVLLVANKGDHTLGIIDPLAGRQVASVEESGVTGHEVIASPDGRTAYVPIYGDAGVGRPGSDGRTLDVIDLASRKRVATIDFGAPERPHCPLFGPDGRLYVTAELSSSIKVVDPKTLAVVDTIPTGQPESHMLALTRDGRRAYTSNVGVGTVSAIDLAARKVVAVIPVSPRAQRLALSVDDRRLFTADQTAPRLAVIDTTTNALERWVPLPGIAYGTAPTPDGRFLVVALIRLNQVGLLDLDSMRLTRTLDVPAAPQMVVVTPDGRRAYVSCDASGKVAAIDLAAWKLERLIDAGPLADGLAWAPAARE
jgi:YVTN family beta-propeller protein